MLDCWQLLEEVGFVSVRAEDRTEFFVRMLKKELKRLTDSHDEFVKASIILILVFSTRCNICILRLSHDVNVRLTVRLSVTFVHCGHRVQWIPDACLDRWMSLLLTNNASPRSLDGMMPGFLVEEGRGMEKLVIVAISLNLLTESVGWMDRKQ